MVLHRIWHGIVVVASLIFSIYFYFQYIWHLGFPDGYISPRGHAQYILAWGAIGISAVLVCTSVYLGTRRTPRYAWFLVVILAVLLLNTFGLNWLIVHTIPSGTGG